MDLPPHVQRIARYELNETPNTRARTIQYLREMILAKESLSNIPIHDNSLLRFLRASKFVVEKAYERAKNYSEGRHSYDEDYRNLTLSILLPLYRDDKLLCCLPGRADNGSRIVYLRAGVWDYKTYPAQTLFRAILLGAEKFLDEPESQIVGVFAIFNFQGFTWKHCYHYNPAIFYKSLNMFLRILPVRLRAVHIVNENSIVHTLFNMAKPVLTEKISKRIHFHGGNMKSLHKYINPSVLPPELHGRSTEGLMDPHFIKQLSFYHLV